MKDLTKREITKGEKLIAKFMGMMKYDNGGYGDKNWWCYPEKDKNPGCGYYSSLQYYNSWEWLMEVVGKINDIKTNPPAAFSAEMFFYMTNSNCIFDLTIFASRQDVFENVVKFIEWYNKLDSDIKNAQY